ncbi:hypothetical protein [Tenacibaculum aiptasiae]|uniref:hypothetical protein n=1 Tax=Tenacibaculum aiptasiae TaxID=426481 RepID=UPI00232D4F3D|nr:hypothetical protein [Tenacibaculum aiptasiae]
MKIILKNIYPAKNLVEFKPKERWIQMTSILQGNYFVSTEGRVMRLTINGLFRIINPIIKDKGKALIITLEDHSKGKQHQFRVASLVLSHFLGGYYKRRNFSFKNNNPLDCRLKNLYWSCGFDNGVDYDYISNLKMRYIGENDKKVVEFLRTKKIQIIYDLVELNKHKLNKGLINKNLRYDVNGNISTITLTLYDSLLEGKYKPVSNKVTYKKVDFLTFLIGTVCLLASKEMIYKNVPKDVDEDYYLNKMYHDSLNIDLRISA